MKHAEIDPGYKMMIRHCDPVEFVSNPGPVSCVPHIPQPL